MYEHNALGYWSGLALCLTKVRSSRARCPATALIMLLVTLYPHVNRVWFYYTVRLIFFFFNEFFICPCWCLFPSVMFVYCVR